MRLIGRLLCWGVIVLLLLVGWQQFNRLFSGGVGHEPLVGEEESSIAYHLERGQWITFPLLPADRLLRLLGNAELPPGHARQVTQEEEWLYAIEWRLVDGAGGVVADGVRHYRSRLTLLSTDEDGWLPFNYYLPTGSQPLDGRASLINLDGYPEVEQIQLRLVAPKPPVSGVVVRLYRQELVARHKIAYRWQRMGAPQRERLARASIYPVELLREEERDQLLSRRWLPVGPRGVDGVDYRSQRIYRPADREELLFEPPSPPAGRVVHPDQLLILPLPLADGVYRLEWQQPLPTAAGERQPLSIEWYGVPATIQRQWQAAWQGDSGQFEASLANGRLLVSTAEQLVVRLLRWEGEEWRDVTPPTRWARLYGSVWRENGAQQERSTIRYRIEGQPGAALRIDLRRRLDRPTVATAAYRLLDGNGRQLVGGELALASFASRLERPADGEMAPLSEPLRHHLLLPVAARSLELQLPAGHYGAAYSRLIELPRRLLLPAVVGEEDLEGWGNLPAWYPLRPDDEGALRDRGDSLLISLQSSPPEVDPELLAGRYDWQSYLPEGDWRGRQLLIPAFDRQQRAGSEGSRLFELPRLVDGSSHGGRFDFVPVAGLARPALYYQRLAGQRLELQILLDGEQLDRQRLGAASGLLDLPPVTPGRHQIEVKSLEGRARLLLSGVAGEGGWINLLAPQLRSRSGADCSSGSQPPDGCQLRFDYRKEGSGEELLSIRYYPLANLAQGWSDEQLLRIDIGRAGEQWLTHRPPGPHRQWSVVRRLYRLQGQPAEGASVVGSREQPGRELRIILPLGEDLPPGDYRLTLTLEQGHGGYLILSRTRPGRAAHQELFRE